MFRSALPAALLLSVLSLSALGQQPGQPTPPTQPQQPSTTDADDNEGTGHRHLWVARMQGGNYMVLVGKIASISKHEYVSDGIARVVEVTIATHSSVAARFYYLEPVGSNSALSTAKTVSNRLQGLAKEAAGRTGNSDALYGVTKNYPTTTHAHTAEFRLRSEGALNSLYRNIARTMETGKGRVYNEPSE